MPEHPSPHPATRRPRRAARGRAPRHAAPTRGWLSGSSLAAGGAASLTVGAVLGGALAGVPNLLSPPSVAGPASPVGTEGAAPSGSVALTATRAARAVVAPALVGATTAERHGPGMTLTGSGSGPATPDAPGAGPSGPAASGTPTPVGLPVAVPGTGTIVSAGAATSAPGVCTGALCSAAQAASQATSAVPGLGGTASGVVSALGGVVHGLAPALPAPLGSVTAPLAPGTLSGVHSTVAGVLSGGAG